MSYVYVESNPCMFCGETTELTVDTDDWNRYLQGELIQYAFPHLDRDQRELINTGIHQVCWSDAFGDEEDDETIVRGLE